MLQEEYVIDFKGKNLWEFGSGVGLLGIYLGAMGANIVLSDLPQLKNMIERNINLNKNMLKGSVSFV
jgi:tRNA1(Val) A37 N6-methylase TrmN6